MEAIDLINHQKREEHIARRRELNRLTKAVLNEKDRAGEKEEKLREKLETVKLVDQEAAQEEVEYVANVSANLARENELRNANFEQAKKLKQLSSQFAEINDEIQQEEHVITATVKILVDAKNAQDRISECVDDLKSAWEARIQKGENFLASTRIIEAKVVDLPDFERLEAEAEPAFQEEMKKLAEFNRRLDLKDEILRKNEEFTKNFEKTVAQEMFVREEEAKAHDEWMRQKVLEEQELVEKSEKLCLEREKETSLLMAQTKEIQSKNIEEAARNEQLKKELEALKNERVELKNKKGAKKANNEKMREKLAKMAQERKKKETKKKEIDETAEILRAKVERMKRENEFKKQDLQPLESAISRKEAAIQALKQDSIFNEVAELAKTAAGLKEKRDGLKAEIGKSENLKNENLRKLEELRPREQKAKNDLQKAQNQVQKFQNAVAAKKEQVQSLQEKSAESKARVANLLKIKTETLAKKEEHQRNLDVSLAQVFDNAARIEAIMKNQKTAKELEKKEEALGAREDELRRKEELAKTTLVPAENENEAPSLATGEKIVSASSTEVVKKAPLRENSGKQPLNDATNTKLALVSPVPKKRSRASQEASISATNSQPEMSENDDSVTTTLDLLNKSPPRRSSLSKRVSTPSTKVPAGAQKSSEAPIIFKKKKRSRERASSPPELSKSSQPVSEDADSKRAPQNLFESSSKKTASAGFLKPSDSRKSEEKTAIIFKKKKRVRTGQEVPASTSANQPESSENSKAAAPKSTQESMTDSVMNLYEQADRMRIKSPPRNETIAEPAEPESPSSQGTYATPNSQLPPVGLYERTQGLQPAGDVLSSCSSVVFVQETRSPYAGSSPTRPSRKSSSRQSFREAKKFRERNEESGSDESLEPLTSGISGAAAIRRSSSNGPTRTPKPILRTLEEGKAAKPRHSRGVSFSKTSPKTPKKSVYLRADLRKATPKKPPKTPTKDPSGQNLKESDIEDFF